MNGDAPRSTGDLVRGMVESVSELFRGEVELVKLELRASVARAGAGGALIVGAAIFFFFSFAFVLAALALMLSIFMPGWAAALVVAVLLLAGAGMLGWAGRKRLAEADVRPKAAIEAVKDDLETIRTDLKKLKEKRTDAS